MEGTVSSDKTSVLANYTRNIQTDQKIQKHLLTYWHPAQRWKKKKKGEKTPSQETLQKKKGKSTKEANLHTNPQQEWTGNKCRTVKGKRKKKEKRSGKNNKPIGHGKHGEKKGKTGGTTIELQTNTPVLANKTKQTRGKKIMKTTDRKVKAES